VLVAVTLQVTTLLRPLLWREPGTAVVATERVFFLEHFGDVLESGRPQTR
jgi:hypothetical protein